MATICSELRTHPRRVFVWNAPYHSFEELETPVGDGKRNGFFEQSYAFAQHLLEPSDESHHWVIKPNVVAQVPEDIDDYHGGIVTNPYAVDGVLQRLWELDQQEMTVVDGGTGDDLRNFRENGYVEMFERWETRGPQLAWTSTWDFDCYTPDRLTWVPAQDGKIHSVFPLVKPFTGGDEWFITFPTMKTHNLGIVTLAGKGMQGIVADGYKHFCSHLDSFGSGWYPPERLAQHYQPQLIEYAIQEYKRHCERQLPFWAVGLDAKYGVGRFEPHSQRTADLVATVQSLYEGRLLCIVEGLIGRDGTAFNQGDDHYAGLMIAGCNIFEVDKVTSWLMGHDPRYIPWLVVGEDRGIGQCAIETSEVYLMPEHRRLSARELREMAVPLPVNLHGMTEKLNLGDIFFTDEYVTSSDYSAAIAAFSR